MVYVNLLCLMFQQLRCQQHVIWCDIPELQCRYGFFIIYFTCLKIRCAAMQGLSGCIIDMVYAFADIPLRKFIKNPKVVK